MPQYYLDSPNFATATAVYANATLTVLAPDGYYSSHGIVRSQVNGQLTAYAECESCKGYQKPVAGELLLDLYPGAAAAYSLDQLNTSYSGAAIRVRRASDSTEQDIGFVDNELDTAALATFFESNVYDSDFSSGTDGLTSSGGTLTSGVDIYSLTDVLQFTVNNATSVKFISLPIITIGKEYRVTLKVYIPSTNVVITGVRICSPNYSNIIGTSITDTNQWVDVARTFTASSTDLRFFCEPFSIAGNDSDSIYIRDVNITEVTNGFVAVWYDQSGDANNATQTTTSNQPKIYDASTGVDLENAKPSLSFDGVNDFLDSVGLTATTLTSFHVAKPNQTNSGDALLGFDGDTGNGFFRYNNDGTMRVNFFGGFASTTNYTAAQNLVFARYGTSLAIGYNGAAAETGSATGITTTGVRVGQKGNTDYFSGKVQEIIIYTSDQSANRAGIESNINQAYNIYWDGTVTALLDDYQGAAAAYSVRALNSFYTGPLVRVRRESDNAERDIRALYNGELDTSALASFSAGTNAYVAVWYDQSGNGNDATQTTASAQPKIYDASTGVVLENGKAAGTLDGVNDFLKSSNFASLIGAPNFFTAAVSFADTSDAYFIDSDSPGRSATGIIGGNWSIRGLNGGAASSGQHLVSVSQEATTAYMYVDGVQKISNPNASLVTHTNVLVGDNALYFDGKIQELILWPSDQSANRAGIESNINDFYTIY